MRLFIAVDLNDEAREAVAAEQKRLSAAIGEVKQSLRWVSPAHVHLTIVFLGEVAEDTVPRVVEVMAPGIEATPFQVTFAGLGVFPRRGEPRVLWLGVAGGARELVDIERLIAGRLMRAGITLEERPYHPHLTLGRWRVSRPIGMKPSPA